VNIIADKWKNALTFLYTEYKDQKKKMQFFINGDDPQLYFIGNELGIKHYFFGAPKEVLEHKVIPHDVDSVYCPVSGHKLEYTAMTFSHLGTFRCPVCGFTNEKENDIHRYSLHDLDSTLKGIYNLYNISAVSYVAEKVAGISLTTLKKYLTEFKPAFGRQEVIHYKDRDILLILSKNPTGFNQSIETVLTLGKEKMPVLVLLNDRIPDGTDVSWIWDVEFQKLLPIAEEIIVSGDRTFDMALRFMYCLDNKPVIHKDDTSYRFNNITAIEHLNSAIQSLVDKTGKGKTCVIVSTYSAMLDTREILTGKKLL
jgi:UDP-N-acetylmuramyl tripeptide synthase